MKRIWSSAMLLLAAYGVSGCATSFVGSAYIEGGRSGCEQTCRGEGLQMAGLVHMGEYSSACICEVPRADAATAARTSLLSAGAGAAGAATGVIMQSRADDERRRVAAFSTQ
jgi:hypothetical protein